MSLLSENVIPGNHGKAFETNAEDTEQLLRIKRLVLKVSGVKDVITNDHVFPREFTVHTNSLVQISDIQEVLKIADFHAIPKGLFKL